MRKYSYKGPVMMFDNCIESNWFGETMAESEAKAKNNLTYRYKQIHNLERNAKITLPGKIIKVL